MKELFYFILGALFIFYILDIRNNCYLSDNQYSTLKTQIQILIRQAARWSTAAKQDESSMIAVLHANYGAGYLWALKDIASDFQIQQATGIDLPKFEGEIMKTQDFATKRMISICKEFAPTPTYLTKIGGEG